MFWDNLQTRNCKAIKKPPAGQRCLYKASEILLLDPLP